MLHVVSRAVNQISGPTAPTFLCRQSSQAFRERKRRDLGREFCVANVKLVAIENNWFSLPARLQQIYGRDDVQDLD